MGLFIYVGQRVFINLMADFVAEAKFRLAVVDHCRDKAREQRRKRPMIKRGLETLSSLIRHRPFESDLPSSRCIASQRHDRWSDSRCDDE